MVSPNETMPVPGMAVLDVVDGRRVVRSAPDLIDLNVEGTNQLMAAYGLPPLDEPEDGMVVLDEAGEYRYRLVERDRWDHRIGTYKRVP